MIQKYLRLIQLASETQIVYGFAVDDYIECFNLIIEIYISYFEFRNI
jgi:hypothetical protein